MKDASTTPYLIRAIFEWCCDNGLTPYIAVKVDETTKVPMEYVKNGEIVLNISFDATSSLKLGNEFIEFKARFAGSAREIMVPVSRVIAIYARENGQGMAFPVAVPASAGDEAAKPSPLSSVPAAGAAAEDETKVVQLVTPEATVTNGSPDDAPPRPPGGPRPALKRVK